MYIVLHICIYCTIVKKKKKKKTFWKYFLWELVAHGTELILLFPYLRTGRFLREKKGGGGGGGARSTLTVSTPDNRMMILDHSLKGFGLQDLPRL